MAEIEEDFCLPVACYDAVASKRRQHILMAKVLAPCLQLFRRAAKGLPERHERFPERVRIEIGKAGIFKRGSEYFAHRTRIAPMLAGQEQSGGREVACLVQADLR